MFNKIYPVEIEIKKFDNADNQLYVAITIEKNEVTESHKVENTTKGGSTSFNISLQQLVENVNPSASDILKYIPKEFLSLEQQRGRIKGMFEDIKKYDKSPFKKELDNEYQDAVRSEDIETAQMLVDEAAKNAGYTTKAYHGTLTKGITKFKKSFIGSRFSYDEVDFFFTDNLKLAEDYATSEFDADRKGEVISAYIKTSNAFVFDKDYAVKNGYGNVFRDNDIVDVWDNYQTALLDEAEEMRADSIIVKDGQSMMVVAFEPNQIKSAEPITYDNNGNVIPLSERFNENEKDIRYSLSNSNQDIAPTKDYRIYGKDIKLKDNIAPVNINKSETISKKETVS